MHAPLIILDPTDPDLFHTDAACDGLHQLLVRAEHALGGPAADVDALVDQAQADGLLVLDGVTAGLRWCRPCREHAAATRRRLLPLAA
jgi:hypothetical protein